ncbi:hypothetical protein UNSWDHB_505 [Dehalobacter sp. UNSWDHB]|nr:hypothetical protein DHBDCA_p2467 [Dehalobacter sp. DCA]AFV06480.1 hypothetical protein DCF50_p2477 [Dehalobacter sp. CF]EQB22160.1 hypothetical protein UNSWDHB_505 [Dehalobacter sp. UNSWDHB]
MASQKAEARSATNRASAYTETDDIFDSNTIYALSGLNVTHGIGIRINDD